MSLRPYTRGTSILAALVFVAILGVVALGVSALSPAAPASQTAQAASAAPKTTDNSKTIPNCSAVGNKEKLTLASSQDIDKEPCVCQNPAQTGKPRTFQQLKYSVQASLTSGNATVYATRTKVEGESSQTDSCVVEICPAGVSLGAKSCRSITSSTSNLAKDLSQGAASAKANFNTDMAQGLLNGTVPLDTINGAMSADTQKGINDAFKDLSSADTNTQCGTFGCTTNYTDAQIKATQDDLKSLSTCGSTVCAPVTTGDQGDESPAAIDKSLADSKVSLDPSQNQGDPTKCGSSACADQQRGIYDAPDRPPYKSSDPTQTVECYENGTECYPANEKDAQILTSKGFNCSGKSEDGDTVCKYTGNSTIGNGNGGNRGNGNGAGGGLGGGNGSGSGSGGGLGGGLSSMLGNLLKGFAQGLAKSAAQANAPTCSSDPNAYAQQQQQYNMQLQQYNLQLQQYNLQSQYAQVNGLTPPPPPQAPVACQSNGSSNTCAAQPPQPTSACQGTWKPVQTQQSNGAMCTTGWQCAASNSTPPTAQISCQPLVADVGMSIAISYTCGNADGSAGLGFDTQNQTSGSTSTVLTTPPQGTNTANFGVQCRNQGFTANAQCSIQVGRASIVLIATPRTIAPQASSTIGWVTSGMQSCVISSPTLSAFTLQNATNTSVAGAAITPPLATTTDFVLGCTTVGGSLKQATTTVIVSATSTSN